MKTRSNSPGLFLPWFHPFSLPPIHPFFFFFSNDSPISLVVAAIKPRARARVCLHDRRDSRAMLLIEISPVRRAGTMGRLIGGFTPHQSASHTRHRLSMLVFPQSLSPPVVGCIGSETMAAAAGCTARVCQPPFPSPLSSPLSLSLSSSRRKRAGPLSGCEPCSDSGRKK